MRKGVKEVRSFPTFLFYPENPKKSFDVYENTIVNLLQHHCCEVPVKRINYANGKCVCGSGATCATADAFPPLCILRLLLRLPPFL